MDRMRGTKMPKAKIKSFRDIIDRCGAPAQVATALGIEVEAVRKWRLRNRIPAEYWRGLLDRAAECGETITAQDLVRIADVRTQTGGRPGAS